MCACAIKRMNACNRYCVYFLYRSFNGDARSLLGFSSRVVEGISVKFDLNCLVVYRKSPWKVIVIMLLDFEI